MPSDVYNELLRKRGDRYDELKPMSKEELIQILDGLVEFHDMDDSWAKAALVNRIVNEELPILGYWH